MKKHWITLPLALIATLMAAIPTQAETIQTPLTASVTLTGSSGGGQSGQCGFVAGSPNQIVNVTAAAPLRFNLTSGGQPTLLIKGPVNRCLMGNGGSVEVVGVWQPGTYEVFVGDQAQGSHPYTLTITPEN